jgi:hypothetical protein
MKARSIVSQRLRMFFLLMKERLAAGADQLFRRAEERSLERHPDEENIPLGSSRGDLSPENFSKNG